MEEKALQPWQNAIKVSEPKFQEIIEATGNSTTYAVESMEKTIDANPQYFGAEQARLKADKNKQEGDLNFSQIVVARAREYMAKHGEKNFAVAKTAVLRADLELAANYTKMEVA